MHNRYFILLIIIFINSCSSNSTEEEFSCFDGIKNGNEIEVDCGGNCTPCRDKINIPTDGYTSENTYSEYNLVWQDDFNSAELDATKWSYHLGTGCPNLCGWGNNELQYFTNKTENLFIQDGYLIMNANQETFENQNYTSSRIHTDKKFSFKYGRVDIRAAMPSATGTWAALWMLNSKYTITDPAEWWPKGGEIDIVEYVGEKHNDAFGTAHYGSNLSNHRYNSKHITATNKNYNLEFYVYSIIWEENKITWLINDVVYHSISKNSTGNQPYPFNDDFFLLFSLSVGGNLPIAPIANQFPSSLIIDYVKVFQKE